MEKLKIDVPIEFAGKEYLARPSHRAIAAIEASCGSIGKIFNEIVAGDLSVTKTVHIFFHTFKAGMGPSAPSLDDVGDLIAEMGLAKAMEHLNNLFECILLGSDRPENSEQSTKN